MSFKRHFGFPPRAGEAVTIEYCHLSDAAFYRCEVKVISRGDGRSAAAAAAYRSAELVHDRRTGDVHDYARRQGVEHAEIVLPDGTPAGLQDRAALWNAAEEAERRKNARVAREVLVSMPHELDTPERRVGAARDLATWLVKSYGVGADFAVHEPDRKADERNYHAHILITTRRLAAEGFGEKTRELDDKTLGPQEIERIRQSWQDIGNRHLERAGHDPSLDRRSLKDRGIEREPEPKLGPVATDMERAGRRSNAGDDIRAVKQRNAELDRLKAERKVIDLAIERARRSESSLEPSQRPGETRSDRRPELNPSLVRNRVQDRQHAEWGEFNQQDQDRRSALDELLERQYGEYERQTQAELDQLQQTMEARNRLAAWWAYLSGRAEQERQQAELLRATLADSEQRRTEARDHLDKQLEQERAGIQARHVAERSRLDALLAAQPQERQQQERTGPEPPQKTEMEPHADAAENRDFSGNVGGAEQIPEPAPTSDQNWQDQPPDRLNDLLERHQAEEPPAPEPEIAPDRPAVDRSR